MNIPKLLLGAGERVLPLSRHVPFVCQRLLIEQAISRLLAKPLAEGTFDVLNGNWLRLEISDLGLSWCVSCSRQSIRVAQDMPATASIRGNWREFLLLASRQEDPDTLFFRRRLMIEGDTEFSLAVKNMLDSLDPDDIPAPLWRLLTRLGEEAAAQQGQASGQLATGSR